MRPLEQSKAKLNYKDVYREKWNITHGFPLED